MTSLIARLCVLELGQAPGVLDDLQRFSIQLVDRCRGTDFRRLAILDQVDFDVLLVCCCDDQSALQADAIRAAINKASQWGVGLCLVVSQLGETTTGWLNDGADALVSADQTPATMAVAVFMAHNSSRVRRALTAKVAELEQKLEHNRTIDLAKSIIAQQIGISEKEAMQKLRRESRNQRRPMWELAGIVIEANRIFDGRSTDGKTDGKPSRNGSKVSTGEGQLAADRADSVADGEIE